MNLTLFAYGTLQIAEVMHCVTGREFMSEDAVLRDFACYRIKNKPFPGILPQRHASVTGRLYRNLCDETVRLLDHFEDDFYRRQEVEVITCQGAREQAHVYVVEKPYYGLLTNAVWDLDEFKRESLLEFLITAGPSEPRTPSERLCRQL